MKVQLKCAWSCAWLPPDSCTSKVPGYAKIVEPQKCRATHGFVHIKRCLATQGSLFLKKPGGTRSFAPQKCLATQRYEHLKVPGRRTDVST